MIGEIIDEFEVSLTRKRAAAPSAFTNGIATLGADVSAPFTGAVVPASPTAMLRLPEGRRSDRAIEVYTETDLVVADVTNGTRADVVTYEGRDYEVLDVRDWNDEGGF